MAFPSLPPSLPSSLAVDAKQLDDAIHRNLLLGMRPKSFPHQSQGFSWSEQVRGRDHSGGREEGGREGGRVDEWEGKKGGGRVRGREGRSVSL